MAAEFDTITIPELESDVLTSDSLIPFSAVTGRMKKAKVSELSTFVLNGTVIKTTISEIRSFSAITNPGLLYTTDTGKEGFWQYDATDTTSADNLGTILVSSGGKRFKRILEENCLYMASWFGVVADGLDSSAVSNRAAYVLAANYIESIGGGMLRFPKGTAVFHRTDNGTGSLLQERNNLIVEGYGKDLSVIKQIDNATNPFWVTSAKSNFIVRDLGFDGGTQAASRASVSLQFDNCSFFKVIGCSFKNMRSAVWMNGSGSTTCHDFDIMFNYFYSAVDFGVRCKENQPYNGYIYKNYFENITQGIAVGEYSAIRVSGVNINCERNFIKDTVDTGIMFTRSTNCSAIGNDITSQLVSIFAGTYSVGLKIHYNTMTSAKDYGVHAYNPPIDVIPSAYGSYIGNKVNGSGKACMRFEGSSFNNVTGNTLLNPGANIGAEDRDRTCILFSTSTNTTTINVKSDNNTAVGNTCVDDRDPKRMKYGIFDESASTNNKIIPNTVEGSTAEKIRSTTNTYEISRSSIKQTDTSLRMTLALGVGETTTVGRPDATSIPYSRTMLFDTDLNKYIWSNGTAWDSWASISDVDSIRYKAIGTATLTTKTLVAADANRITHLTASSAVTVTIPTGLPVNARYEGKQLGTGKVNFVPATGVTLRYGASVLPSTAEQYSVWYLDWIGSETYMLYGKLQSA